MFVPVNRIKSIREARGKTIEEIAEKTHKSVATIYRYERGEVKNIPDDTLAKIADLLETTPEELRGDDARKAALEMDKEIDLLSIVDLLTSNRDEFNMLDLRQIKSLIEYVVLSKNPKKRL